MLSQVQLFATPWTIDHKFLCPQGFSKQEYWSGLPFPSPGDPPDPEPIEPRSPALQADSSPFEPLGPAKRILFPRWKRTLLIFRCFLDALGFHILHHAGPSSSKYTPGCHCPLKNKAPNRTQVSSTGPASMTINSLENYISTKATSVYTCYSGILISLLAIN